MAASKRFLASYSYFTPRIFMIPRIYRNQTVAATSGIPHRGICHRIHARSQAGD